MSPPRKRPESTTNEDGSEKKAWVEFRWCDCPSCLGKGTAPCERRGGWFWGPGHEKHGQRPSWMTRGEASWRTKREEGNE